MLLGFVLIGLLPFLPQDDKLLMPREIMAPALGGGIYVGDDLECTSSVDGVWRYGTDKYLYLCMENTWRDITIVDEAQ